MPKPPRRPKHRDHDERFSLQPLTFEQAVTALVSVEPMDERPEDLPPPSGTYKADLDDLVRAEQRISAGLFGETDDPTTEWVDDAVSIREFIEDEGYRHSE